MKFEIFLLIVLMSFSIGERQQRSTVLTDESKRVLEQFDFSSFDKQEALNYLDRQRYENQVRGKRSQSKLKLHRIDQLNRYAQDLNVNENQCPNDYQNTEPLGPDFQVPLPDEKDQLMAKNNNCHSPNVFRDNLKYRPGLDFDLFNRNKRGHRHRKNKTKLKTNRLEQKDIATNVDQVKNDVEERSYIKKRKRKKKRKKRRHYWDHWSEWSPCSVTCGRGRKIRSRKCIVKNCTTGELEMGEKTCQLPACNLLSKILGL